MTKTGQTEQTADLFSKPTWSCTAEGEPGEENGPNGPGGYCPAWGRNGQGVLWWTKLEIKKRKFVKRILCWSICDDKINDDKKFVMKLKNSNCDKLQ